MHYTSVIGGDSAAAAALTGGARHSGETRNVERNLLLASKRCVGNAQRRAEYPTYTCASAGHRRLHLAPDCYEKNTTFAPSNNRV